MRSTLRRFFACMLQGTLTLALVAAFGCGHSPRQMPGPPGYGRSAPAPEPEPGGDVAAEREAVAKQAPPPQPSDAFDDQPAPAMAGGLGSARPARRARGKRRHGAAHTLRAPGPTQAVTQPQDPAPERKVHYQGHAKMMATKPAELLDQAADLAKQAGGYVERLVGTQLTVRVPVDRFREVFAQILELGEVIQRQITARDITDAYQAVDLRLRVLQASRTRLMELLAQARGEHEKLSLLNEIKRLTEQIDQLQMNLQALESLASYSHITVHAVPRPQKAPQLARQDLGVFRWISRLSPFGRQVANESDRLELPVPKGMVAMELDDHWAARSPDGAAIWTAKRDNLPKGSTAFWMAAVKDRLGAAYPEHETYQIGGYSVVELRQKGAKPYRYLVGLRVVGDALQVVEVYYPSDKHQEQYGKAIKRALARASSKGHGA